MADLPPSLHDDRTSDASSGLADGQGAGTPRWVIVFEVVAVILVLAFVVFHLAGGGFRGHG